MNIIEVLIKASVSPEFRQAIGSAGDQIKGVEKTVESAAAKSKSSFSGLASGITTSFAGIGLALSGIKQSVELVGNTIKAALGPSAEMERLQVQFAVMLGSMDESKKRMEELTKFADTTPFELPEVVKASKVLETLTKGALSTGAGLRMVGDVAAATGQPFDELSMWIGRLYDGLQSGRPVGEALMRLQELGVVSGDVRGQIEGLQKEGKKGPEVWGVAEKAFGQYAGMMEAQSKTFEGLSSTMKDSLNGVIREFGDEILPDASGAVGDFTSTLNDLRPAAEGLGWVVGSTVKIFRVAFLGLQSFFSGLIPLIIGELGRLLSWSLSTMIGWAEKINGLVGKLLPKTWQDGFASNLASARGWVDGMGGYFKEVADQSVGYLDGIGDKMAGVYAERGDIDVPGKKKGAGGGGGGGADGKAAKATSDLAIKQAQEQFKIEQDTAAKILTVRRETILASITDERQRDLEALAQRMDREMAAANGNKALLLALHDQARAERAAINKKWDEKETQEAVKLEKDKIEAAKKAQETARAAFEETKKTVWSAAWFSEVDQRMKSLGTGTQQIARAMSSAFDGAMNSLSSNLTSVLTRTKSLTQGMKDLGREILQSVVGAIIQTGVKWVQMEIMKATVSKTMAAASLAVTAPIAAAQAALWTTPATLATIATMGGAAAAAPGEVAGSIALTKALASFEVGTPRVPRDMLAQIHSGEGIIPKNFMDGIRSGELSLGGPGAGGGGPSASLVLGSDIIRVLKTEGRALVQITDNQRAVAFS